MQAGLDFENFDQWSDVSRVVEATNRPELHGFSLIPATEPPQARVRFCVLLRGRNNSTTLKPKSASKRTAAVNNWAARC